MAKTDGGSSKPNQSNQKQDGKKKEGERQKSGKKEGQKSGEKKKKKEPEYKPGMSYLYDPCPHRVWTPKPGERDKGEPRGAGSPWYEPTKKKEDVDKEEAEKSKKKEEKAKKKRDADRDKRKKEKEEEDKKNKEKEEKEKKEKEKKDKEKEEKKKKREKEKKEKEKKKKKEQEEKRNKEKEKKKKEEEENKKKGKKKEQKVQASYMYEPCPHKVHCPAPGEKDLADPKWITSPWYEPPRKKEDIEKEDEEERAKDAERRRKERKEREKQKAEEEKKKEEENRKQMERAKKLERKKEAKRRRKREENQRRREEEERKHEEMGAGVRDNKTDFTPELSWLMDLMSDIDENERERKGEDIRWKKEEIEEQIESHMAKEAFTNDFRELVSAMIEAEWLKADTKQRKLEKLERKRRREVFKNMDPLAIEMMDEGLRFRKLYNATIGRREKVSKAGEATAEEDMMVSMIMRQMDHMMGNTVNNVF